MEKPPTAKSINKILKLLPKVSQAAVSFQNPPNIYSPRDHHYYTKRSSHLNKGFAGTTMIPFIPNEKSSKNSYAGGHENTQEPTSPKISCMGQIKHKHEMCKKKHSQKKALTKSASYMNPRQKLISQSTKSPDYSKKNKRLALSKLFGSSRRKSDALAVDCQARLPDRAPCLSQVRRFASSRDTLADFDWTTAGTVRVAVEESCRDYYYCSDEGDDDDDVVIIPFSSPMMTAVKPVRCGGDLERRKEINLWKRRTMAQPKPLQLDMVKSSSRK